MPDGGTLTLATARRDAAVELLVSDPGKGLTPEERDRLFTPYYTTKQHGTGLGLAIVQSVVSDHGGTISVEPKVALKTRDDLSMAYTPGVARISSAIWDWAASSAWNCCCA